MDPRTAPHFTREELDAIRPPDTCPADFDAFWRSTFDEAMLVDPQIERRAIWSPDPDVEAFEVYYTSWGGVRIGAWMTRPRRSRGGIVVGHGYGGRPWFELDHSIEGYTAIMPCIRGFHLSAHSEIPWQGSDHVLHGIESRDDYVIRGSVADVWIAASVLEECYPDTVGSLTYSGGSFGGGLGALALPWDNRFRAAHLEVPTFGHHPRRLQIESTGSAESVRRYSMDHPDVGKVLAYYDAATAAQRITIPVLCSPALFDPAVTPPGQWAVANAIADRELFVQPAGHIEYPELAATQASLRKTHFDFMRRHTPEVT